MIISGLTTINYDEGDTRLKYVGQVNKDGQIHGRGTMYYTDGSKYVGESKNGEKEGYGKETFSENDEFGRISFEGLFENTMFKFGTMIWKTHGRYEGNYENNKRSGQGTYSYADGAKYEGQWQNNQYYGHGVYTFAPDDVYKRERVEGDFENDDWKFGTLIWKSGEKYVGQFKNHLRSGNGTNYYTDGRKYEGEWLSGEYHGHGVFTFAPDDGYERDRFEGVFENGDWKFGTEIWKSGDKYVGQFKNQERSGNGTHYYTDGQKYEGEWLADKRNGYGKIIYPDDDNRTSFEGEYENDETNFGTLIWKTEGKYVGEFKDNDRTGKGTYYYTDGTKYVGQWQLNKRHGQGILYSSDGKILNDGEWKNDSFVA